MTIYMQSSLDALVSALQLKFLDTEWDVRDAAIQFVGQLFKEVTYKKKQKPKLIQKSLSVKPKFRLL